MPGRPSSPAVTKQHRSGAGDVLGPRALNRALLERQMLLRRRRIPVLDAVELLVGMQAQVPNDPYVGLWTRLDRFRAETLATAMGERRAVRMTLLRGTLHLVTARDALALRPVIQPVVQRTLYGQTPFRRALAGIDVDELIAVLREQLEERPRTRAELVRVFGERWPDHDASSLAYAMYLLPLVQVTPRGIWGQTGRSAFTTVAAWLGRPLETDVSPDEMILRYLVAFGPSTVADVQTWSGLTGMRAVLERLRPRLRTFRDERGRELFDVPDGPLPDPETPAPVRFLPEFDNVFLSHDDRSRIVDGRYLDQALMHGFVLVEGFIRGVWKLERRRAGTSLVIGPWGALTAGERVEVEAEATRLLDFAAEDVELRGIRFES